MLVRLELSNFKSYRGHQTIGPFKPFSSIIGPNGSGKSNLMDAISFVLGIKSAQLRSKQLKDLVYRGRKLARGGYERTQEGDGDENDEEEDAGEGSARTAWVLAVYQDEEGEEYRFQRTVSIAGSSEYKINNKIVTYTVYNQALEKHNILVKARNFLVFQGDVEAIARQSPKDLCRLIEQISGSAEFAPAYDKAKEAQDKATANSTENFHNKREIAKEFKAYKEHKTEAAKLTKLKDERDELVAQHVLWRLFHINEGVEAASANVEAKDKELNKLRDSQSKQDSEVADARKELASLQSEILKQEKVIKRKEKVVDQEAPKLVAVETQIAHSEKKAQNAESLSEKVERDRTRQNESLTGLRADLAKTEKLARDAEDAQRKAAEQQGKALSDEDIAEYRQLKARANAQVTSERQRLDALRREESTLSADTTGFEEKLEHFERQSGKLSAEVADLEERRASVEAKVGQLQADRSQKKADLESLQSERTRINQLETETNEKLQSCYNKLIQANGDKKQTEKETKMKETIATLKRIFPGVHGRVVDLCKPTQTRFQTAVSIVLGRNIDAIVIDHEKTAIECINYLRTQRLGQATFIPLDSIQVKPTSDKYRSIGKGARLAIDVIEFNAQFEAAMQHACGNSLVCDSMDIARNICYDKGNDVKAVTIEGTVIHKSGSITGGQSSQGAGRKWDEKEVQGLHKQRDSLMAYLKELLAQKPKGKTDENYIGEISRLDAELVLVRDDLSATRLRLTGLKEELTHAKNEVRTVSANLQQKRSALQAVETQVAALASTVNEAEDTIFADFCERIEVDNIREYEEVQLRVAQRASEARVLYDAQIARLKHQSTFEAEQLESTKRRLQTLRSSAQEQRTSLEQLQAQKTELEESIQVARDEVHILRQTLEGTQSEAEEKKAALEEVKKLASKSSKVLDKALKEIAESQDTIERLGIERAAIYRRCKFEDIQVPLVSGSLDDVPMEALDEDGKPPGMDLDEEDDGTQRPLEARDYGIEVDFSDLSEEERDDGSDEYGAELEDAINKLVADIARMAPNMRAADKMGGVQAKLTATEKEAEKARKESHAARDAFNAVKKKRADLFNAAYQHIHDRIDQVYKDLTKGVTAPQGGVAYLSLEDSEEPYLAGVKYHAMPPMKRFRDMDQLSGGEQTVAALALLFAIHSYQPAPFFVLDEVDAALDNTNVARVARYLREHSSEQFQFIVISLKDTLYEKSNSLVGVYRDQDVNSSRTLTLDLQKYDA